MPELRKDPVIGRWVIIATERGKRPSDFVSEWLSSKMSPVIARTVSGILGHEVNVRFQVVSALCSTNVHQVEPSPLASPANPTAVTASPSQPRQPNGRFTSNGDPADPHDHPEILALLTGGLLASDAGLERVSSDGAGVEHEQRYRMVGDPTEGALVVAAAKAGLWRDEVEDRLPRVAEIPFDSERKRMTTIHHGECRGLEEPGGAEYVAYVKGAPDVLLPFCDAILEDGVDVELTTARRQHVENVIRDLGREGLRVLAVAYRHLERLPEEVTADEIERDLALIGLVHILTSGQPMQHVRKSAPSAGLMLALAGLVVWAMYGFEIGPVVEGGIPVPIPTYVRGLQGLFRHSEAGHPAFLHGDYFSTERWDYFPVAFAIKTPLPTLILLCLSLGWTVKSIWKA